MEITVKDALIAEIEKFKTESLKSHIVQVWAESYKNSNAFDYIILEKENNKLWWMKVQAHQLWELWQAAKAQAIPDGYVLVDEKCAEDWYLDESENIYHKDPDWLCNIPIGEVVEVDHYVAANLGNHPVFAVIQWDDEAGEPGYYKTFISKEMAEKAAAHCKAMIEAQGEK